MSTIRGWLREGDLRTDGAANKVAELVAAHPDLLPDLMAALHAPEDAIGGRAADALEKVARTNGQAVLACLDAVITRGRSDRVPMVRWHMAMILGHIVDEDEQQERICNALMLMLRDESALVRSWAVVSASVAAKRWPHRAGDIISALQPLAADASKAVRTRTSKALTCLLNPTAALPAAWVKSGSTSQTAKED